MIRVLLKVEQKVFKVKFQLTKLDKLGWISSSFSYRTDFR